MTIRNLVASVLAVHAQRGATLHLPFSSFALQRRAVSPLALALLPLLMAATVPSAHAQDGSLDPTFSFDGKVIFGLAGTDEEARAVAVQPDGKIVVAGYVRAADNTSSDFLVLRYDADGSLDPTFGTGGIVTTSVGSYGEANAVALQQPDGKIVVAGVAYGGAIRDIAVVRYNADGSLDPTFDTDGIVITDLGGAERANAVALQPDGRIVVAGVSNADGGGIGDFAVVRYNADGSLDLTFDTDGSVITNVGGDYSVAQAVARQSDGRILVAGYNHRPSNIVFNGFFDLEVVRYNADGSLDPTFDTDGVVTYGSEAGYSLAVGVAVQADTRIVVAGRVAGPWGVLRYNADGSLDPTFDTDGIAAYPFGSTLALANALALPPDGKIVVAGLYLADANSNATDFAVVRYTADGALDLDFGTGGNVTTNFGGYQNVANAVALQPDGKIVAAGSTRNPTTFVNDFALARYTNTLAPVLDSDGDGVPDAVDVCPGSDDNVDTDGDGVPDGCDICALGDDHVDGDADGIPDACDVCPLDPDNDADADGVCGDVDLCAGTVIPEAIVDLGPNRWALINGDFLFDTSLPPGQGPTRSYDTTQTRGCSCTQIVQAQGLGGAHLKFGCSTSVMDAWISLVATP